MTSPKTCDSKDDHCIEAEGEDPATAAFLDLLENDISTRSDAVIDIPTPLVERWRSLVHGIEVDLEAPIEGQVDM